MVQRHELRDTKDKVLQPLEDLRYYVSTTNYLYIYYYIIYIYSFVIYILYNIWFSIFSWGVYGFTTRLMSAYQG